MVGRFHKLSILEYIYRQFVSSRVADQSALRQAQAVVQLKLTASREGCSTRIIATRTHDVIECILRCSLCDNQCVFAKDFLDQCVGTGRSGLLSVLCCGHGAQHRPSMLP